MKGLRTSGLAVAVALALSACQSSQDTSATAVAEVRAADLAWAKAFELKNMDSYLSFVDSTAIIHHPNAAPVIGRTAIRELVQSFYALHGLTGTWQPVKVVASRSGDLAYSTGTYALSYDDPPGNRVTDQGKYLEVWRKQSDGSWKMVVESFSSDAPPAGATH